jgi:hypothetical protein
MKRRTRTTPVRIYTFGCRPPTENADLLHEQLRLANVYRHKLIEIEIEAREQYRAARREVDRNVSDAEAKKNGIDQQIRDARQQAKKDKLTKQDTRELLIPLLASAALAKEMLNTARERAKTDPALKTRAAEIAEDKLSKQKAARASSGVFWGSYLLREKAHEATLDKCRQLHVDPKHTPWDGSGRVGIQLQKPCSTADVLAGKSEYIRITVIDELGSNANPTSVRSRQRQRAIVRIRVGSDEHRKPIWASLPVLLHRPIPTGRVTWAWIRVARSGLQLRYELQLTLESDEFPRHEEGKGGVVELKLCWIQQSNGICVGDLSDGTSYVVPQGIIDRVVHAREGVRGPSDASFDEARRGLLTWIAENEDDVPEWMHAAVKHASKWNRHGKLRWIAQHWASELMGNQNSVTDLWRQWSAERRHANAPLYGTWTSLWPSLESFCEARGVYDLEKRLALRLYWWRQQDNHLTQWEADETRRALGYRKDLYRCWARDAARRYSAVRLDPRNLASDAELGQGSIASTVRQLVAPSELRTAFAQAFGPRVERPNGDEIQTSARITEIVACSDVSESKCA